nr:hypothetical protein [Allomuricauda sp.]
MENHTTELWNSLEIVKLAASSLTPLVIVGLSFWINYRLKNLEKSIRESERVSEKRVELYDEIGIKANKIFAYIWYVGTWKETSPREILDLKRELDTKMHTYKPWFSDNFFKRYRSFILATFDEYQGHGKDAKIKTTLRDREKYYPGNWEQGWNDLIADEQVDELPKIYNDLLQGISHELGLDRWTNTDN